jgi:hypothetical protein
MPLPLGPVTPGRLLRPFLPDRLGQSVLDGPDARFQVLQVRQLAAAGQRPLVMRGLGDRSGPPRRRQRRQLPLTTRPRFGGVLQGVPAARLEILRASDPRCELTRRSTFSSSGVRSLRRVRMATPLGPDATNDDDTLRSSPTRHPRPGPTRRICHRAHRAGPTEGHAFDARTSVPRRNRCHSRGSQHDTDHPHSLPLTRTPSNTLQRQQLHPPRSTQGASS